MKNVFVLSQLFIPSWKKLFILCFKGGPPFVYMLLYPCQLSLPFPNHPLGTLKSCLRGDADSKPQLRQEHPQQHPQLRGTAYRARYLAKHAQKKEPSATGMGRLFLVAWLQGTGMCNISLSAAFLCQGLFLRLLGVGLVFESHALV